MALLVQCFQIEFEFGVLAFAYKESKDYSPSLLGT